MQQFYWAGYSHYPANPSERRVMRELMLKIGSKRHSSNWNAFIRILIADLKLHIWKNENTQKCYYKLSKLVGGKRFLQCIQNVNICPGVSHRWHSPQGLIWNKNTYWIASIASITSSNLLH